MAECLELQPTGEEREEAILAEAKPCPFCGCTALSVADWWGDEGETPAVECSACLGAAPAGAWNRRNTLMNEWTRPEAQLPQPGIAVLVVVARDGNRYMDLGEVNGKGIWKVAATAIGIGHITHWRYPPVMPAPEATP